MKAIGFVPFATRVLGVKLTRAQRVLCLVAFDGVEPRDLTGIDRDIARKLFGDVETIPADARNTLVGVCGARAGKTRVLVALRMLHLALTVDLSTLAAGEQGSAIIVAPDLRLARQALRFALGAAKNVPSIAALITNETADSFALQRDGHLVALECLPASRGGAALRGRSLVGAALDEAAFFRDEDAVVNDAEVYKALAPRVMLGGQLIIASTPWGKVGLLFDLYTSNFGAPRSALVAHAPTSTMRDDARTLAMVERERERDAANAAREFDAEFMAGGSAFFDADAIERCIDTAKTLDSDPIYGAPAYAGADFGFRSDSSAIAIVQSRGDAMHLARLEEMTPTKGHPLQPGVVVGRFAEIAKPFGQRNVAADGHYAEAIREHLATHGLSLVAAPEGTKKVATYLFARELINAGRLRLPDDASGVGRRLVVQLRAIVAKPTGGGQLQISAPRRTGGGHGDLVSALVLACWQARRATSIATFADLPTSVGPRPLQW